MLQRKRFNTKNNNSRIFLVIIGKMFAAGYLFLIGAVMLQAPVSASFSATTNVEVTIQAAYTQENKEVEEAKKEEKEQSEATVRQQVNNDQADVQTKQQPSDKNISEQSGEKASPENPSDNGEDQVDKTKKQHDVINQKSQQKQNKSESDEECKETNREKSQRVAPCQTEESADSVKASK
ncbi:hypothetical protein P5G51_014285 [Virgibacillus sp. 179-BFC.A HS]|uniref:Uncharacterized protein n=1 Tax=Tigheibacillus jepli TaxID=3035914 RepID=A0ABU5CJ75_9BACI|nr:hypothetical protein [Virgibacillus sp. 179-BFC.A HS]MDY0406401.1 hypothetical protein [Virgibacillus sp. 179-BFC.A HS]